MSFKCYAYFDGLSLSITKIEAYDSKLNSFIFFSSFLSFPNKTRVTVAYHRSSLQQLRPFPTAGIPQVLSGCLQVRGLPNISDFYCCFGCNLVWFE
ncbi:hypothetical protein ES332_D13G252600v1 [Gossypium tomentosum]|uniref:Uncharacterized protein n=1 Tax=Gossypium tomentosum TaxID=34277 RepID=A0A5D2I1J4_GOSTO|nr:hypothetical protein ES332_D13G252600v1 [Gossypium tomentosum]